MSGFIGRDRVVLGPHRRARRGRVPDLRRRGRVQQRAIPGERRRLRVPRLGLQPPAAAPAAAGGPDRHPSSPIGSSPWSCHAREPPSACRTRHGRPDPLVRRRVRPRRPEPDRLAARELAGGTGLDGSRPLAPSQSAAATPSTPAAAVLVPEAVIDIPGSHDVVMGRHGARRHVDRRRRRALPRRPGRQLEDLHPGAHRGRQLERHLRGRRPAVGVGLLR